MLWRDDMAILGKVAFSIAFGGPQLMPCSFELTVTLRNACPRLPGHCADVALCEPINDHADTPSLQRRARVDFPVIGNKDLAKPPKQRYQSRQLLTGAYPVRPPLHTGSPTRSRSGPRLGN